MSFTPASTIRYTAFRIALATGILGAVGATLGWIGWLTGKVMSWELIGTVGVGAALGLIVHWTQHYIHVAKREREGVAHEAAAVTGDHRRRRSVALSWAGGFAFLGLVSEHLVAHMAAEFFQPLLASLASLLPAGMIIGWRMNRGRPADENVFQVVAEGLITGGMITAATGFIWYFGFGEVPWFALACWWGMVGIGMRLMTRANRSEVRFTDPIWAVAMVFAATFLLNLLPTTRSTYERFGVLGNVPMILRTMAAEIQHSPALPAKFWLKAEERFQGEHAKAASGEAPHGAPEPVKVDTTPRLSKPVDIGRAVANLTSPSDESPAAMSPGEKSEYLRSWLVILLFAVGVGLAPGVEEALRPADYPNSRTFRQDLKLTGFVVLLLLIAMFWRQLAALIHVLFPSAPVPK